MRAFPSSVVFAIALSLVAAVALGAPPRVDVGIGAGSKAKTRKKQRTQPPPRNTPKNAASTPTHRLPPPKPPEPLAPVVVELDLQRATLPNGLRVVLNPDPALPSATVAVAYAAGHAAERDGQQGFASVVHHVLATRRFEAQGNTDPSLLPSAEASIDRDVTLFVTTVSPGAVPIALWREAHRMASPGLDEAAVRSHLDYRRAELRAHTSLGLHANARLRVEQLAYQGFFPYVHAAHDMPADLDRASLDALTTFRQRHYAPNHAVIAVSGRFVAADVLASIRKLFSGMQAQPLDEPTADELPDQINQRVDVERKPAPTAEWLLYGWAVPPAHHVDHAAIELAAIILRDRTDAGTPVRSARLRALPENAQLSIQLDERRGPSLLTLRVDVPAGDDMDRLRRVVDEAIADLGERGPTPDELRTAWRSARLRELQRLEEHRSRTTALAIEELVRGDATAVTSRLERLAAPNIDEVRKAVRTYLTPIRRNLVELRGPKVERPPRDPAPEPAHAKPPQNKPAAQPKRPGGKARPPSTPPPSPRKPGRKRKPR